jgi:hypothetical protein
VRKTLSLALMLMLVIIAPAWADSLTEEMTKLNSQWDAAINGPNFDALLPMYTADAALMPPGAPPSLVPLRSGTFSPKEGPVSEITSLSLLRLCRSGTTPTLLPPSKPRL